MNNSIELQFDKTIAGLAANPYGQKIYHEQVKGKVDENERIEIIFPNRIERIASSFVQGFFADWIDRYGVEWIKTNVTIQVRDDELHSWILKNLT